MWIHIRAVGYVACAYGAERGAEVMWPTIPAYQWWAFSGAVLLLILSIEYGRWIAPRFRQWREARKGPDWEFWDGVTSVHKATGNVVSNYAHYIENQQGIPRMAVDLINRLRVELVKYGFEVPPPCTDSLRSFETWFRYLTDLKNQHPVNPIKGPKRPT